MGSAMTIGVCEYCSSSCIYCKGEQRDMRQTREQGTGRVVLVCSAWGCQLKTMDVLVEKPVVSKRGKAA
jgi:hypothetical protein